MDYSIKYSLLAICIALYHRDDIIYISIDMSKDLVSVEEAWPGCRDFGDGAISRDRKVCVHKRVGDIRQCLR